MMIDSFTVRAPEPPSSPVDLTQLTGWVPCHDRPRRHAPGHDAAGAHDGVAANLDTAQNRRSRTDRRAFTDDGPHHRPVAGPCQFTLRRHGTRVLVVDERHAVPDKHLILDLDPFADEGVALDLDAATDLRAALDLDERADPRFVADLASVQVDEIENLDVPAQPDVGGYRLIFHDRIISICSNRAAGQHVRGSFTGM